MRSADLAERLVHDAKLVSSEVKRWERSCGRLVSLRTQVGVEHAERDPLKTRTTLVYGAQQLIDYLLVRRQRRLVCIQVFRVHRRRHDKFSSRHDMFSSRHHISRQRSIPLWRGVFSDLSIAPQQRRYYIAAPRGRQRHGNGTSHIVSWTLGLLLEDCDVAHMHRRSVIRDMMPYTGVPYSPIGPSSKSPCRARRRDIPCSQVNPL
jgi:hypothetical protein